VYGYASTEALDVQGERVSKDALAKALPAYMKFANIREMHQPSAVGVAKQATLDEKGLYLSAKVVDDIAWNKVKEGVYKGFSIGGKTVSKVDDTITELRLSEISLVDRPANPEAIIEVWKADGIEPLTGAAAINALAELIDAGKVKPEQLLAFAKAQDPDSPESQTEIPLDTPMNQNQSQTPQGEANEVADSQTNSQTPESTVDVVNADSPASTDAPSEGAVSKSDALAKYAGEEIYDAALAIQALSAVYNLFLNESTEDEQQPDQIAALTAVIDNLKRFIASEIAEDNSEDANGDNAVMPSIAMSDSESDIGKAGKEISSKNLAKVQALHDTCISMGAKCAKGDDMENADKGGDIAKVESVLSKFLELEGAFAKMSDHTKVLEAQIKRFNDMPAAPKGALRSFNKNDDSETATSIEKYTVYDGGGNVNEAASLIKQIHKTGGIVGR